jgi:hypothetical protein
MTADRRTANQATTLATFPSAVIDRRYSANSEKPLSQRFVSR